MKIGVILIATLVSQIGYLAKAQAWTVIVISGNGATTSNHQLIKVGMEFNVGQSIQTPPGVKVKLQEGFSIMVIGENSEVFIENSHIPKIKLVSSDSEKLAQISLKRGVMRLQVDKKEATKFRYSIPSVVAGVRGTQFFMSAKPEKEVLCVLEGEVGAKIIKSGAETKVEKNIGWIREGEKEGILVKTSEEDRAKWIDATEIQGGGAQ